MIKKLVFLNLLFLFFLKVSLAMDHDERSEAITIMKHAYPTELLDNVDTYLTRDRALLSTIRYKNRQYMGAIFRKENAIFVAFHGTDSLFDVWTDIHFKPDNLSKLRPELAGQCHEGFLTVYEGCDRENAENHLREAIRQTWWEWIRGRALKKLYFVGHSLGGALAQLAALEAAHIRDSSGIRNLDIRVVTCGSPQVFDSRGAETFNQYVTNAQHTRYTISNDIVPYLPACFPLLYGTSYEHTGIEHSLPLQYPYKQAHMKSMLCGIIGGVAVRCAPMIKEGASLYCEKYASPTTYSCCEKVIECAPMIREETGCFFGVATFVCLTCLSHAHSLNTYEESISESRHR